MIAEIVSGFALAFAPGQAEVWAVGDAAAPGPRPRALARRIRGARPDLFLYLGDVYPWGSASDFRRHYHPLFGALAERTMPTPGNHEWAARARGYFPYWRRQLGRPLGSFHAREIGGWEILSVNSELRGEGAARQLRWLRGRLAGERTCRIVMWHRPRRSAGIHGDSRSVEPLWRAARGRARLVLNGHDHDLQRFRDSGGTVQLISGAGGQSRYRLRRDPRLAFGEDDTEGALRMVLQPGSASLAFVSSGGRVLDRSSVRCV